MAFGPSYTCVECGATFAKSASHTCNPQRRELFLAQKLKEEEDLLVEKFRLQIPNAELTPRMQRQLDFLEWCRVNGKA